MKLFLAFFLSIITIFFFEPGVRADMIRMQDGQIVEGKFLGGTEYVVRFHTVEGTVEYPVEDILSISFLPPGAPLPERTPMSKPTPKTEQEQDIVIVPRYTRISVQLLESLDTLVNREGDIFRATLEADVVVNDTVLIPKGSLLHGKVLRSDQGKTESALVITIKEVILDDQEILLETTSHAMWDRVQDTPGTVTRRVRTLRIPSESVLEFKTTEAVTIDMRK